MQFVQYSKNVQHDTQRTYIIQADLLRISFCIACELIWYKFESSWR